MIDPATSQRWLYHLAFFGIAATILLLRILPLDTTPSRFPGPDILLCLAFAWVQRRPEFVPPLLLGLVFFLADMLLMRPPGLWALLALLGAEFLRSRQSGADMPFTVELLFTASVIVAMTLLQVLVLSATGIPHPGIGMYMVQMVMTIVFYPPVVLLSRVAFKVRRLTAAELAAPRSAR